MYLSFKYEFLYLPHLASELSILLLFVLMIILSLILLGAGCYYYMVIVKQKTKVSLLMLHNQLNSFYSLYNMCGVFTGGVNDDKLDKE